VARPAPGQKIPFHFTGRRRQPFTAGSPRVPARRGRVRPPGGLPAAPVRHTAAPGRRASAGTPGLRGYLCEPGGLRQDFLEAHATHLVATRHRRTGGLGLVGDDGLGGEEERRDGGGVLQGRAGHLNRVVDAGGEAVLVLPGGRVDAIGAGQAPDLPGDDARLEAGVEGDLLERRAQRELDDVRAGELLALERQTGDRGLRLDQGHAAAGDDALLDGRLGVTHGVLDAVLALLELDLGGRARPDDGDAAGELGEALLELLAVVVRVGVLDLGADLADPALDLALIARALDDRGLVLGHGDLAGLAQHGDVGGLEREADLLGDDLA